jgi:hypothetical protein
MTKRKKLEEKMVDLVNTYSIPTNRQVVSWSCRTTASISSMVLVRGARLPKYYLVFEHSNIEYIYVLRRLIRLVCWILQCET